MQNYEEVQRAAACLAAKLPPAFRPRAALVCGTGLGELAKSFESVSVVPFEDLPGVPLSTVASHEGRFIAAYAGTTPVLLQQGRCHLYEGYSSSQVCAGVRVMRLIGAEILMITNAAGCLNPQWDAGDLMLITDHINCTGQSPLSGPNIEAWGPRFPDMSAVYDQELIALALKEARSAGIRLERGVYAGVPGPELETPAHTRMLRLAGADAVGMSTVLEVIAARHMGMRVLGLSCLSNKNLPDCMGATSIEEIIEAAQRASGTLTRLVSALARKM